MDIIIDDTMAPGEVKVFTNDQLYSMSKRNFLSGDVARNPGKTFYFRIDELEKIKHLKLTDKQLPSETCDNFIRNHLWHPQEMRWIPTTSLKELDFNDRVYIGAVAAISEIKRFKPIPNISANEPKLA